MKRTLLLSLCVMIPVWLFLLALPASADWNRGQPYKWLQGPDMSTNGMDIRVDCVDSPTVVPRFLADDFLCTSTGPITGIHLWGSWLNDFKGRISKFYVGIYADIPDPDGSGPLFSIPGQRLWGQEFTANQFTERLYGELTRNDFEWWWDPFTGELEQFGDQLIYQYNLRIDLKNAFVQQGTADKPIIYWLEVLAEVDPTMPDHFGWKTRTPNPNLLGGGHFQDNAVLGVVTPNGVQYSALTYPEPHPLATQPIDLAFVLTTTEYQPDLFLRASSDAAYIGNNIYSTDGLTQQRSQSVLRGSTATYLLRVQNDGTGADSFLVKAAAAPAGWTVKYLTIVGGVDVTASVNGAGWSTGVLAVGALDGGLYVKVTPSASLPIGSSLTLLPTAISQTLASKIDVGRLVTNATGWQPDLWLRNIGDAAYIGDNIYSADGATQQRAQTVQRGSTATYLLRVQNDGSAADSFLVKAAAAPAGWTVKYLTIAGGVDVTASVNGAGWSTGALAVGAVHSGLYVKVTPSASLPIGSSLALLPTAISSASAVNKDVGRLVTTAIGWQPDLWMRNPSDAAYIGDNVYSADGLTQQRAQTVDRGSTATYLLRVQNDGSATDTFLVKSAAAPAGWSVKYLTIAGAVDVTGSVTGGGWSTGALAVGAVHSGLYVKVTPSPSLPIGSSLTLLPTATSTASATFKDVGKLVTTASGWQPDLWMRAYGDPAYMGNNIYTTSGVTQQRGLAVAYGGTAVYYLRVQNDGSATDTFTVKSAAPPAGWTVQFVTLGTNIDVTADVTGAGWSTGALAVGALDQGLYVKVTPAATLTPGVTLTQVITATSTTSPVNKDVGRLVTTLVPFWNPGDPFKWRQMPDLSPTGMDIRVDGGNKIPRIIADDFQCTTTGPITDIHFWGSWLHDLKGRIAKLHLSIYEDIPDPDGDKAGYSEPGKLLWKKEFTPDKINERLYRQLPQGQTEWFWDLSLGTLVEQGDTKIYQYDVQIKPSEAFVQQGSASAPIIYWLAIEVELEPLAVAEPQFGWKTRDPNPENAGGGHFLDDAVWGVNDPAGSIFWQELRYPDAHPFASKSLDMAFVITTNGRQYQPDGMFTFQTGAYAIGDNIYNLDGTGQMVSQAVFPGSKAIYDAVVQNDGNATDRFILTGTPGDSFWTVKYFNAVTNADITAQMTGTGWVTNPIVLGGKQGYRVEVTPSSGTPGGTILTIELTATSVSDPTKKDVIVIENVT